MLGRDTPQKTFFDADHLCFHLLPEDSFYYKLYEIGPRLISDDDFASCYSPRMGRPSVPPSLIAKVMLLQYKENLSDREALERVKFDLRWKAALRVDVGYEGFEPSLLSQFRARLIIHKKERTIFEKFLSVAQQAGLIKSCSRVMDSSHMLGAAAVQDTFELLRTGIQKVLRAKVKHAAGAPLSEKFKKYLDSKHKQKINWEDKAERQKHLESLVGDARQLLEELGDTAEDPHIREAGELLCRILS